MTRAPRLLVPTLAVVGLLSLGSSGACRSGLSGASTSGSGPENRAGGGPNGASLPTPPEPARAHGPLVLELECPERPFPSKPGCIQRRELPDCVVTARNTGSRDVFLMTAWLGERATHLAYEAVSSNGRSLAPALTVGSNPGDPVRLSPGKAVALHSFILGRFNFPPGRYRIRASYDPSVSDLDDGDSGPWHGPGQRFFSNWATLVKVRNYAYCDEILPHAPASRPKRARDPRCDDPDLDEVDRLMLSC